MFVNKIIWSKRWLRTLGIGIILAAGSLFAQAPAVAPASDPGSGSLFTSIQALGLKLEPRKAPMKMIVVDHIEKMPTEN
jgi:uncharacterized protein (TIGR03435 family)